MIYFDFSVVRPISSRFKSPPAEFLRPLCDLHMFVKFAKQKKESGRFSIQGKTKKPIENLANHHLKLATKLKIL